MIIVWPDNSWCFPLKLWDFYLKSDEYTIVDEKDFHTLDSSIQAELGKYYEKLKTLYGRSE